MDLGFYFCPCIVYTGVIYMIVNGYAYPTTVHTALNWWLPRLTWLSVFSYGITEGGRLTVLDDEELIRTVCPGCFRCGPE